MGLFDEIQRASREGRPSELREAAAWKALESEAAGLDSSTRSRMAERWARAALFEHASIASFSKFSLELLAVGAPPALLRQAHQAALDEIEHARLSFRIASLLAGRPLGPGPLSVRAETITDSLDLPRSAAATVRDGCVNETLAAAEAEAAAEHTRSPVLRQVLSTIAADEARHAALAWEYAAWAVRTGGESVRSAIREQIDRATAGEAPARAETDDSAWGLLTATQRHECRVRTFEGVVRPSLASLISG